MMDTPIVYYVDKWNPDSDRVRTVYLGTRTTWEDALEIVHSDASKHPNFVLKEPSNVYSGENTDISRSAVMQITMFCFCVKSMFWRTERGCYNITKVMDKTGYHYGVATGDYSYYLEFKEIFGDIKPWLPEKRLVC